VIALIGARGWQDRVAVDGEPLTLTTDPRRLERILVNLIGNAVEHSGRDVAVQTGTDGARGFVEVADAGPGIPPSTCRMSSSAFTRPTLRGPARAAAWASPSRRRTPGSWTGTSA
jgi:C4-dicarboxylate-specific signal transduction histidine kinase